MNEKTLNIALNKENITKGAINMAMSYSDDDIVTLRNGHQFKFKWDTDCVMPFEQCFDECMQFVRIERIALMSNGEGYDKNLHGEFFNYLIATADDQTKRDVISKKYRLCIAGGYDFNLKTSNVEYLEMIAADFFGIFINTDDVVEADIPITAPFVNDTWLFGGEFCEYLMERRI